MKRFVVGLTLVGALVWAGCSAETEPTTEVATTAGDVGATLRAKVSWESGERGYWRWELSESPTFASGVVQTARRDFGPMGGAGGPATIAERVRSSSCAGVNDACTVISSLTPSTRYYVRFCGELSAPNATGYRCFDSNSDEDPPHEYDSFVTPDQATTGGPELSGRLYAKAGQTVTPGSYDVVASLSGGQTAGTWTVELKVDGETVAALQHSCGSPCAFVKTFWLNTAGLRAGSHAIGVITKDPAGTSYVRSWGIDVDPRQTLFSLDPSAPLIEVLQAVANAQAEWLELRHSGAGEGGVVLGSEHPSEAIQEYVAFYAERYGPSSNPLVSEFTVGGDLPTTALGSLASKVQARQVIDPTWDDLGDTPDGSPESGPAYPDDLFAADAHAETLPEDPRDDPDAPGAATARAAAPNPYKLWAPTYGKAWTYPVPGRPRPRTILLTLTWGRQASIDDFNRGLLFENYAYEHDFKLINRDNPGGLIHPACGGNNDNFWARRSVFWDTNFPKKAKPYFDTDDSDSCEYQDFTVGLYHPLEHLRPRKKYEIIINARAGNKSSSPYILAGQRLRKGCDNTPICVGITGGEGQRLVGESAGRAPECRRWRKGYNSRPCF